MENNRFDNALLIQEGACNPHAILQEIQNAIKETLDAGDHVLSDAAIRLMIHQLAHIFDIQSVFSNLGEYKRLVIICEKRRNNIV